MKQRISIAIFMLGLILVIFSFALRESYEKDMYQLYISQQKNNLVKGWTKSWQDYLALNYQKDLDFGRVQVLVDRNGKMLDKNFFPTQSEEKASWGGFQSLNKDKQFEFLKLQLAQKGSWDRAMAIKILSSSFPEFKIRDLSLYEETLSNDEKRDAVKLIFDQIERKGDFSKIDKDYSFDTVLLRSEKSGEISLTVPSLEYLQNTLFHEFQKEINITEIELAKNSFSIQVKKGFNPFKFNSTREKFTMAIGFLFVFGAVGLYLIELKNKRLEILKKVSFLNQLVHEVKTPITGIRLNSELLLKHGYDEELVYALIKSSKRLNDFFEDIILINRGDQTLNLSKMSAIEFSDYIMEIASEFNDKNEIKMNLDTIVNIDKGRLRVVLRNLLKNAIRYGKKGELEISLDSSKLIFRVKDEGPGIDFLDSSKIFEEFYRAKSAKNSSPDGLGIGLAIVKNLVHQMNGSIELKNPGEEHALFELRLDHHES